MENSFKLLEAGFQIKEILLMESSFSRIDNPYFEENYEENPVGNVHLDVDVKLKEIVVSVRETVTFTQHYKNVEQVKLKVEMVGNFVCFEKAILENYEEFGKTEGAAIIYPYIREHITNITSKSYEHAITLPPIVFTKVEAEQTPETPTP
jgi:preprotein translocase subunit SecB